MKIVLRREVKETLILTITREDAIKAPIAGSPFTAANEAFTNRWGSRQFIITGEKNYDFDTDVWTVRGESVVEVPEEEL